MSSSAGIACRLILVSQTMNRPALRLFAAVSLLCVAFPASAQQRLSLRMTPDSATYYPWIEQMLASPTEWFDAAQADGVLGVLTRAVVLRSEIYVALFIERVSLGDEGCCVRLRSVHRVDLEAVARAYGLRGELSRFSLDAAVAPGVFRVNLQDVPLTLRVTGDTATFTASTPQRIP